MKRLLPLLPVFFLFSCGALPVIQSSAVPLREQSFTCPFPFLKKPYRLVQTIETRMAGKTRNVIIGVTLIDPVSRSISCAVLTAEGMVLFEAASTPEELRVTRALPPFDSESFAENMLEDIRLIFLEPQAKLQERGYLSSGERVCRYLKANGDRIDVIQTKALKVEIKRYTSSGTLKRHIMFDKAEEDIYQLIELRASETMDYSLLMTLMEAQPVNTP
ncbi:MAG TPA: DUF3261 domain-containing protein [Smithella sp.]|nr:DUF3261 domain-containing protein [Smithella sp.]HNY49213.1 DUF3261 domain-containing protein [Smithella sp.]HOG88900.1 DUF3261 domain-containing protein [Smithella sp.]HQH15719.1 DUF3261 domain-containing protein [Smithella sp.]